LLEAEKLKPQVALPEEDAFYQTDVWLELPDKKMAIQVKREKEIKEGPVIKNADMIDYPAILTKSGEREFYYSNRDQKQMHRFVRSCRNLEKIKNIEVRGLYVILPEGGIDSLTGVPSPELKEKFKKEIEKNLPPLAEI